MSERWGKICPRCEGVGFFKVKKLWKQNPEHPDEYEVECPRCMGTGEDGSILAHEQKCADDDWEKDRPDDSRWTWG